MMRLLQVRDVFARTATLSRLSVQYPGPLWYAGRDSGWVANEFPGRVHDFAFVLEDEDRGLESSWDRDRVLAAWVRGETAIPATEGAEDYRVVLTWSARFHDRVLSDGARMTLDGRVPLVECAL